MDFTPVGALLSSFKVTQLSRLLLVALRMSNPKPAYICKKLFSSCPYCPFVFLHSLPKWNVFSETKKQKASN